MDNKNDEFFDYMPQKITAHILIKEKDTGKVLLNRQDNNPTNKKINPLRKYADLGEKENV